MFTDKSRSVIPAIPRVLIVEDDTIVRTALEHVLRRVNCDVVGGFTSGEEAVERASDVQPDLILMDVRLAGTMDGIEAASNIRARSDIPVIYLTGYTDELTLARAANTGAYGYLVKPIHSRELHRAIEMALAKHAIEQELAQSEARYRRMFQAAAVALWETDIRGLLQRLDVLRQQGVTNVNSYLADHPEFVREAAQLVRVIDVNEMSVRMFEAATREELLGPLHRLLTPKALSDFRKQVAAIAEGRTHVEYETVARTFSGRTLHTLVHVTLPSTDDGGTTTLTSITDITERVQAEGRLRELHEQVQRHAEELEQRVADRTRELSTLYAISESANDAQDQETMLQGALKRVLDAVRGSAGSIHLLHTGETPDEAASLRLTVAQDLSPSPRRSADALPTPAGALAWIIANDAPLVLCDAASSPGMPDGIEVVSHHYVGMPMRAGGQTIGVLSVLRECAQPVFTADEVALLTLVADQIAAVVESARLRLRAEQAAVVEERQRLARELHDSVTQSLYSLTLLTEGARRLSVAGRLENPESYFDDLRDISLQCLKEMRLLVYELRASGLKSQSTLASVQQRLDAVESRAGMTVHLQLDETLRLPRPVEEALAGIAHEALNNALKHSHASNLLVRIGFVGKDSVELIVTDNGCGFIPVCGTSGGGIGLATMHERAERAGGTLTLSSSLAEGTTVTARLPISGT